MEIPPREGGTQTLPDPADKTTQLGPACLNTLQNRSHTPVKMLTAEQESVQALQLWFILTVSLKVKMFVTFTRLRNTPYLQCVGLA